MFYLNYRKAEIQVLKRTLSHNAYLDCRYVRLRFKGEPWGLHRFFSTFRLSCSNLRQENEEVWRCCSLTSSHRMPYVHAKMTFKHAFRFLRVWPGALPTCHAWRAIVSRSPWGYGSVAPDSRHCKQWMSSLFLPNPFIQDLFLWHTSQEIVKTDLYPLSRGLWSLSGMPSVRLGAGQ